MIIQLMVKFTPFFFMLVYLSVQLKLLSCYVFNIFHLCLHLHLLSVCTLLHTFTTQIFEFTPFFIHVFILALSFCIFIYISLFFDLSSLLSAKYLFGPLGVSRIIYTSYFSLSHSVVLSLPANCSHLTISYIYSFYLHSLSFNSFLILHWPLPTTFFQSILYIYFHLYPPPPFLFLCS